MKEIPIFKAEASVDGLVDLIRTECKIAYATKLEFFTPTDKSLYQKVLESNKKNSSFASLEDSDLYFTRSILVTSNWNKNDDVFSKIETWGARHTPAHKPTNINHDHDKVCGHIVDSWAINLKGDLIADGSTLDDVPDVFHIVNASVIYGPLLWKGEFADEVGQLIEQIEAGNKYVSMECLFSNFGYALISPDGKFSTLARNENTAFLTKHLKVYGGTGEYEDYKIGRLLANITFSGKGYVDSPANPDSIIFDKDHIFSFASESQNNPFTTNSHDDGVSNVHEDILLTQTETESMSEQDTFYKTEVADLKAQVSELTKALTEANSENSKANISSLNETIADLTQKLEAVTTQHDTLITEKTELQTAKASLETEVVEVTEAKNKFEKLVEEAHVSARTTSRIAELVGAGASEEDAKIKVGTFASMDDEQWAVISSTLKEAYSKFDKEDDKKKKDKEEKAKAEASKEGKETIEEEDSAEANADESVLEKAESKQEPNMSAEASDDEKDALTQTRKELRQLVEARLGYESEEEETK